MQALCSFHSADLAEPWTAKKGEDLQPAGSLCDCEASRPGSTSQTAVDMDDEDGRCLLDVICDPQALNDFLHGSESQLDSDDLFGGSGNPAGSFFVGSGHHIQEPRCSTQLLASEHSSAPSASVDLDFLEDDDILGSPHGGGMPGSDQPCDILQQSLAEANITEQSLQEAEEELDLETFGLPNLPEGTPLPPAAPAQLFQGLANKAINMQPLMQQMGLGNVTLQSLQGLQALPNGGSGVGGPLGGPLGISQIQVVGQQVMAIHQTGQPVLTKSMGGYQLAPQQCAPQPPDSLQPLQGKPPGGALNGGFGNGPGPPSQCSSLLQPQNIVIQRTPTPIQPKPPTGGVIQPKIYQLSPKTSFSAGGAGPGGQASTQGGVPLSALQGEGGQKQQQQNVAVLAGKPGQQNLVFSTPGGAFPQALSASLFKHQQGPQQQQQNQNQNQNQSQQSKPLSLHLLNQAGSIVIPSQAMLQGQSPFLLPPHLSSALQGGGQILAHHPGGGHIIASQGPGGQLIANQILSNHQSLAGQLNLGQVLASQGPQGHIQLSGPIQLQGGGQALFQMPVSLAGGCLQTQSGAPGAGRGMTVPCPALTVLNQSPEPSGQALASQQPRHQRSDSALAAGLMTGGSSDQQPPPPPPPPLPASMLTAQIPSPSPSSSSSSAVSSSSAQPLQISAVHLQQPPSLHSPGQIIISQQGAGMVLSQESVQLFLQQQQALFQAAEKGVSPASSCVPASVIVSSSSGPSPSSRESLSAEARPGQVSASFGSPHSAALVYQFDYFPAFLTPDNSSLITLHHHSIHQPFVAPLGLRSSNPESSHNATCAPKRRHPPLGSRLQVKPPKERLSAFSNPHVELPQPDGCRPGPVAEVPGVEGPDNHPGGSPQPQSQQQGGASGPPASVQSPVLRPHSQSPYQLTPASQPEHRAVGSPSPLQLSRCIFRPVKPEGPQVPRVGGSEEGSQPAQSVSGGNVVSAVADYLCVHAGPLNLQLVEAQLQTLSTIAQPSLLYRTSPLRIDRQPPSPGSRIHRCDYDARLRVSPARQTEGKLFAGGVQIKQGPLPQSVQLGSVTTPFTAPPSKEARMLEQLRRQQGAVLHPDYQSPFSTFGDALQRLLPYHLYQGTPSSGKDYTRVDEEFHSVSVQLLKRTQAMLNKYRLLLFEESRRQGPSAEMVMIDRMFIQEEKTALSQDKVLAKERPDEYVLPSCVTQSLSTASSSSSSRPRPPASSSPLSRSATAPPLITPTKLVIKHGGGASPSVSWARAAPPPSVTSSPGGGEADSLPSRSSRPPMKTYEARRRIGLKLKIKQEAGLSKVVHNTALDPIHTPASSPKTHAPGSSVIRTVSNSTPATSTATGTPTVITATQVNGTLGHPVDRKQPTPTSCRLPLRKTYRENVSPVRPGAEEGKGEGFGHFGGPSQPQNTTPTTLTPTPIPTSTTSTTFTPQPRRLQTQQPALLEEEERGRGGGLDRGSRTVIATVRLEKKGALIFGKDRERQDDAAGFRKQLSGEEGEFYRTAIKHEPLDHCSPGGGFINTHPGFSGPARARGVGLGGSPEGEGRGISWDSPFSSVAKRRKSESLDVDNASFSSGSPPQDDSLNEHLQSAIDSILNLQQGQGPPRAQPGPCRGPSNTHRQQQSAAEPAYPPTSHNGGVDKARTYRR
ncbi:BRD4-interacting chromatin-remodeling complex-associated protein-like [Polyodon spathula]|uniref:BRD4-interacting chromatin-remodeling complex-associated protein-like n=1 Tax=Polyodon spathula TaxID=7913 RepID=UPI001B7F2FD3|nr:BRD4-interacting chromatin-remodeling complex-associated protein-like [Polyodon spathula]